MSNGLDLLGLFVNNFDIQVIYELGWYAAWQWTALISGIVLAIAISIRMVEEKIKMVKGGASEYMNAGTTVLIITVLLAVYFSIAWVLINFFQSLYGVLNTSDAMQQMTSQLDSLLGQLLDKDYAFSWSDIVDSAYAVLATFAYAISFCALIFVIVGMRVAHALLVSFCLFWGSVALPMSVTVGMKQLESWGKLCVLALIWPIVDAFLMYLVSGVFSEMLTRSGLGLDAITEWNLGHLLFYMGVFSIINVFLIATTVSAPVIAQALASGSGNVSGLVGSFATAGIAAGVVAGNSVLQKVNNAPATLQKAPGAYNQAKEGAASGFNKARDVLSWLGGGGNDAGVGNDAIPQERSTASANNSTSAHSSTDSAGSDTPTPRGSGGGTINNPSTTDTGSSGSTSSGISEDSSASDRQDSSITGQNPEAKANSIIGDQLGGAEPVATDSAQAQQPNNVDSPGDEPQARHNSVESPPPDDIEKRQKAAKRGAIINNQKSGK